MSTGSESGLAVLEKNLDQKTDDTLTRPEGLEPERKSVEKDTISSRIVLICPYSQIGACIEGLVSNLIPQAEIDSISEGETFSPPRFTPPHIDVREREKSRKTPYWVIDSNRIIIEAPNREAVCQANLRALQTLIEEYKDAVTGLAPHNQSLYSYELTIKDSTNLRQGLLGLLGGFFDERFRNLREQALNQADKSSLVERVVDFDGYSNWAQGKILVYISPKLEIVKALKEQETYDETENFIRGGIAVAPYQEDISRDLLDIAQGKTGEFRFFCARN